MTDASVRALPVHTPARGAFELLELAFDLHLLLVLDGRPDALLRNTSELLDLALDSVAGLDDSPASLCL